MSTIQTNQVKSAPVKHNKANSQPQEPQAKSADQVADEIRLTGQQEIDRGTQLKQAAAEAKATATEKFNSASEAQAQAEAGIQEGLGKIASGSAEVVTGYSNVSGGHKAETAANEAGAAASASILSSIEEAKPINKELGVTVAKAVAAIGGEVVMVENLTGDVNTFQGQVAHANELQGSLKAGSDNLKTQIEAEHAAAQKVENGMAALGASHDAHAQASGVLNDGLGLLAEGFKLNEQGKTSKTNAVVQGQYAENFQFQADSRYAEAADLNSQGNVQFGIAAERTATAGVLYMEGNDRIKVADLLAQVADIDRSSGESLTTIAGFASEGKATIETADEKAQASTDNAAAGQGLLDRSSEKFTQAGDAFKAGKSLKNQAKVSEAVGDKFAADAQDATAKQEAFDAQGDQQLADGKAANDEGAIKKAAGSAGVWAAVKAAELSQKVIDGGVADGQAAIDAQKQTATEMEATLGELKTSAEERAKTAANIETGVVSVGYMLGIEQKLADKSVELGNQLSANTAARQQAVSDLEKSVSDREAAFAQQEQGVAQVGEGTNTASEGAAQIRTENVNRQAAQIAKANAEKQVEKADAQAAGADVIIGKGQKYVEVADKAQGK